MKTVLAAVDFSDATPGVVEEAAKLAQQEHADVTLLHVTPAAQTMPEYPTQMPHYAEGIREIEATIDRQLGHLQAGLKARGVTARSLRLGGEPKKDIAEQGEKLAAEYIVMGSHGHSAFEGFAIGSTTNAVINSSKRVVVVVPAPQRTRTATA